MNEAFEKWLLDYKPNAILKKYENGKYISATTENYFNAWEASISAHLQTPFEPLSNPFLVAYECNHNCDVMVSVYQTRSNQTPILVHKEFLKAIKHDFQNINNEALVSASYDLLEALQDMVSDKDCLSDAVIANAKAAIEKATKNNIAKDQAS